ncbi:hypothetical protein ATANTOWER_024894 [Ataeniobius toweri]|uniref:Uncharacterized protein n=1 Tax=Ataeniobius toweri TaxID=208326 RepID=A0ABU7AKL5_9TELE|nr:hypothetical protein [Ataeniobius toweri]
MPSQMIRGSCQASLPHTTIPVLSVLIKLFLNAGNKCTVTNTTLPAQSSKVPQSLCCSLAAGQGVSHPLQPDKQPYLLVRRPFNLMTFRKWFWVFVYLTCAFFSADQDFCISCFTVNLLLD